MKKTKGFTLIELLIAMSIATLIAMAFFSFLNSSIRFNNKNEQDIKALNIAQSEVENLREQIKSGKDPEYESVDAFETIDNVALNKVKKTDKEYENNKVIWKIAEDDQDKFDDKYNREIKVKKDEGKDNKLYTIEVVVSKKDSFSTKRETRLVTKVYGG